MIRFALLAGLLLTGCADPTEGKTEAEVRDVTEAPTTAPAPAGAKELTANGSNSKIEWVGAKITKSHPGGFKTFNVKATIEGNQLITVQTEIDMLSLFSDSEKLTGHLKDADFFDVDKFGKATFTSTNIKKGGEGGATHTVTGVLEMHGAKKEVSFPATVDVTPKGATLDAEFAINRQDWGLSYPGRPDDLIQDKVLIKLDINFS